MISHGAHPTQQPRLRLNRATSAGDLINEPEPATLILDGLGNICGCGAAAQDIFGASHSRLIGRRISAYIAGVFREEDSPSRNARFLAHLCADSGWRQFAATDARGRGFTLEISISLRMAGGREVFVIALRRPGETSSTTSAMKSMATMGQSTRCQA
jgi:PAS domain-containing protein